MSEPNLLDLSASLTTNYNGYGVSCYQLADGAITATVTGGTEIPAGGYIYNWTTDPATSTASIPAGQSTVVSPTGLTAGNYLVTVTDQNGCTISGQVSVNEPAQLVITSLLPSIYASGYNITGCFPDGYAEVTVSGGVPGYTYDWNNDGTGDYNDANPVINIAEGWLVITTQDLNGCVISDSIFMDAPDVITIVGLNSFTYPSGDNISCFGLNDGSIDLTITGGTGPYNYNWTSDPATPSATIPSGQGAVEDPQGLTAGTYLITITDVDGCSQDSLINLTEPSELAQNGSSFVYPSGDNIQCHGDANGSMMNFTVSGGSPAYSYSWTADPSSATAIVPAGQGSQVNPTGLTAGTYNVTVTDVNGCAIDTSITLIEPMILSQTGSAFTYASGDNIQCNGDANGSIVNYIVTGGSPSYSYSWTADPSSSTAIVPAGQGDQVNPTGLTAGTYNVTVTDINGCSIDTSITLIEPAVLSQTGSAFTYASSDNIQCNGDANGSIVNYTVTGGSPAYSYSWTADPLSSTAIVPAGQGDQANPTGLTAGTYNVTVTDLNGCTIDTSITLVEPSPLEQTAVAFTYTSGTNISCYNLSDGSIDLTVNGGSPSPGYSYNWAVVTPGSLPAGQNTVEDPSGLTDGVYQVTITDVNGCTIDTTVTLVEPTVLNATAVLSVYSGGYNLSGCQSDGWIDLSVSGGNPGYAISWNNGLESEDLASLSAGTYTVTITDVNGCQFILDTTLTQPQSISSQTQVTSDYNGEDISCIGASDGSVTVTVSGGAPNYQYEWINAQGIVVNTSQSPTGLPSGDYSVAIEDQNGCLDTSTVTLLDPPPIAVSIVVSSDYNGEDISCNGLSDGSIDFTMNGGTPDFTYTWRDENGQVVSTLEDPTDLSAGNYQVIVLDNNGCVVDTSITLMEPQPLSGVATVTTDYNGSDISCYQLSDGGVTSNIQGGTPGYTYTWSNSSGASIGSAQSLSGIPAGTYTVSATDLNGCVYSTNVTVNQPSQVTANSSVFSFYFGQGVSCEGASDGIVNAVAVGGTPTYSYTWNSVPLQATQMATGLPSGTYTVTVSDINGCTSTSSVVLTANPIPQAVLPPPINGCVGGGVLINANAGAGENCTWTFSDGQVFNECGPFVANFNVVDCYSVQLTVISPEGCIATTSASNFVCIKPNPVASFYADDYQIDNIETNAYFWNTSIGASSYYWYYGDGSAYDTTFNTYHEFINGSDFNITNYQVTLYAVSEYGCIDSVSHYITMTPELILYVPNTFTPDGDQFNNTFFPVLTAGYNVESYDFMIFNRWGELIFESQTVGEGWDGTYRNNKCQDDVYTWKLSLRRSFNDDREEFVGHVSLLRGGF